MATKQKETIISVDINFSNGGGGHTATVTSVLGARDLVTSQQEDLGSLIGIRGGKTTFTNKQLELFMSNFIAVEETVSQDSKTTTITRKYKDRTSLLLKSHCFLVRGRDCDGHDEGASSQGSFSTFGSHFAITMDELDAIGGADLRGKLEIDVPRPANRFNTNPNTDFTIRKIPYFSEVTNAPVEHPKQMYPYKAPLKNGAAIFIGNIYNEESSTTLKGERVSLVYQSRELKPKLSYKDELIGTHYKEEPDYTNFELRYGYTMDELIKGMNLAGVRIEGLPKEAEGVLMDTSGNLDAVISAVASKYGYYWYIDPFEMGTIKMVNSINAASLRVTNPLTQHGSVLSQYLNGSITTNLQRPKIFTAFTGTIEKKETNMDNPSRDRLTRFHRFDPSELLAQLDLPADVIKGFYMLWLANKIESTNFFTLYCYTITQLGLVANWGDAWPDAQKIAQVTPKPFNVAFIDKVKAGKLKTKFNLESALFLPMFDNSKVKFEDAASTKVMEKLKAYYEALSTNVYLSHRYGEWKATRMNFTTSPMGIEGPYDLDETEFNEVNSMKGLIACCKLLGKDITNLKLADIFDGQPNLGSAAGNWGFVGHLDQMNKDTQDNPPAAFDDFKLFDEQALYPNKSGQGLDGAGGMPYIAVAENLPNGEPYTAAITRIFQNSVTLFDNIITVNDTLPAKYNRAKRPVDTDKATKNKSEEEAHARRIAGLNAWAQYLDELSERNDIRFYNLQGNGATGNPLEPVQLNVKSGSIAEAQSLAADSSDVRSSYSGLTQNSSRTLAGLRLPQRFTITMSSISIKLGGSGITTTINESSAKLLKPDEQVILGERNQASVVRTLSDRFNASQRNRFGL